ncbi:MAG: SDR family NAD(P)-dependent oxidoreductase, partial [Candidatus Thiodiazotropha sp.]
MTQNQVDLSGKSALITGAAHRIGAAIARQLHAEGMNILLHYRHSKATAEQLQHELETKRADSVWLLQADLQHEESYTFLIDQAASLCQRLDLLVNNASSFYPTPLGSATEDQWEDLLGSNLKAPFFLSQAAAPLLYRSEGCIINLVDIHVERPLKKHPFYSV